MKIWSHNLLKISLVCVIIGITFLSLMPPKSGIELGEHDKINHFIAYTVFSLNAGILLENFRKYLLILPLLVLYGLLMEYCQGFVPGRSPSWLDALANTTGVTIGFILTLIYRKLNLDLFK